MDNLDHKLEDFPDDPSHMDWDKEALLFYHYMINHEDKYEKKVEEIILKFKKIFDATSKEDIVKRKSIYNEFKNELYKIKNKDHDFERGIYFILLMTSIVSNLEEDLDKIISQKEQLSSLQSLFESDIFKEELNKLEKLQDNAIEKVSGEVMRVTRTESWRYVNEQRLDEFKKKGYKYKTTYPVKDRRTCPDSWYYYDQRQVKPIDEPFNYTWDGNERVFMTPPDRPNDRNILIPYVGDVEKYHNEIGSL